MDWVTVKRFTLPSEAYIAQSLVVSGDIPTFLKDELIVTVHNFYSNAVGGVKLQVPQAEVMQALEILADAGFLKTPAPEPKTETFPVKNMMICPYCSSDNVYESREGSWTMILFLFGILLPWYKYRCHCFECGRNWKTHL